MPDIDDLKKKFIVEASSLPRQRVFQKYPRGHGRRKQQKERKMVGPRWPQNVNKYFWYYSGGKTFRFVHEIRDEKSGEYIRTDIIHVPREMLAASMRASSPGRIKLTAEFRSGREMES